MDEPAVTVVRADCVNAFQKPQIGTIKVIWTPVTYVHIFSQKIFRGLAAVRIAAK